MLALRQYFEYYHAFNKVDIGDDDRINEEEFENAMPCITKWVGPIEDP